MSNLEKAQEQQLEQVFQIKEQAIEMLDAKTVQKLQNKMAVYLKSGSHSGCLPKIMYQNGISQDCHYFEYVALDDNSTSKFPYFLKHMEIGLDTNGQKQYNRSKEHINNMNLTLFQLKSVFLKNEIYYFYTGDGQILVANKYDFDENGVWAGSLDFFGNQGDHDVFGNTQKKVYANGYEAKVNGNGYISFYGNYGKGKYVGDIPGDNAFKIEVNEIIISDGGNFHTYKILNDSNFKKGEIFNIPYKGISQMVVDYNKNFLFIINETEEGSTLHIVLYNDFIEKKEIKEVYSIKNVKEICGLGKENGMICLMTDGSLKYYWNTFSKFKTNFFKGNPEQNIPGGKLIYPKDQEVTTIKDSTKTDLLQSLESGSLIIDLKSDEVDETEKIDRDIIDKIWNINLTGEGGVSITLKELFDNANDEESITQVLKAFQTIQKNPQVAKAGGLLKYIEKEILIKKNTIILNSIFSELGDIASELGENLDLDKLITIKNKLYKIKGKRKNIQSGPIQQDSELKELIVLVEQKISNYKDEHREDFVAKIGDNFGKIEGILNSIENAIDISSIYDNQIYQETEEMISCLDTAGQEKYKKVLKNLVDNRRKEIKKASETEKEKEAKIIENKKKEIEEFIEQINDIINDIDDISAIEQYKENDALVVKIKKLLEELPSSIAQTLDLKLDRVFSERIYKLRLNGEETKGVVKNLDSYGIDTILYYDEDGSEQVEWKIEGKEKSDGKITLVVKLMNGETHEYDKSLYLKEAQKYGGVRIKGKKIKFEMDSDEYENYIGLLYEWKEEGQANNYRELIKELRKLPSTGEDTEKISEEKRKLLDKIQEIRKKYGDVIYTEHLISRLIKQQKLNPRSKVPPFDPNFIVLDEEKEILRKLSTRLVDQKQNGGIDILEGGPGLGKTVMCEFLANITNREIVRVQCSKMDPSDMFFSPTLKKGETSREPADWIKLMQKPGTIILFDEIDKLNDQCFERLHSLFDRSRSVYDPQLGKIKANPDCLFLGTRNSYDRMSNPILSRGRILQVNYPGVLNESYKVSKYTDSSILKKMSFEEFSALYDKYITRSESAPNNAKERKIYDLVINIHHLLNVFTELRSLYDSDEPFAFEISYRDARQIFVDYNSSGDFKKSMESILIPKARGAVIDTEDKKTQEDMVRRAINKELPSSSL